MPEPGTPLRILVLHGPNLNLLGSREPGVYGNSPLEQIDGQLVERARLLGVVVTGSFQSNSESELVDRLHACRGLVDGVVFNPAAFTHTSVSLRDALTATSIPFVEVHLSNVHARESFRRKSFFSDIAVGVVTGFGADSYLLGLEGLVRHLRGAGRGAG